MPYKHIACIYILPNCHILIYASYPVYWCMNQQIQQKQIQEQRMLDKANFLVANKRIRRSPYKESKNIWIVARWTPKKWYVVRWNEELDAFMCACKAFEYSAAGSCIHIFAAGIYVFAGEKFESE